MSPTYKVSKIKVALHKMFKLKLTKLNLKKQQPIKNSFQQQEKKGNKPFKIVQNN